MMTRAGLLPMAAVAVFALADFAQAQIEYNGTSFYIQGNYSEGVTRLDSSGFNTQGPHVNSGADDDNLFSFGGAFGTVSDFDRFRLRLEVEGMAWEDGEYRTNSFPGPPGPFTFFYEADVDDAWSALGNMWIDVRVCDLLLLYGGGGLGAAGSHLAVDDTVVTGGEHETDFAYQFGGGIIVPMTDSVEMDLGYRYYDFGSQRIGLDFGGVPAGHYKAERHSDQVMLSVRVLLP